MTAVFSVLWMSVLAPLIFGIVLGKDKNRVGPEKKALLSIFSTVSQEKMTKKMFLWSAVFFFKEEERFDMPIVASKKQIRLYRPILHLNI
jgi:hypothetical protein